MNKKKQIVQILKLLKLHLVKRRFLELKNYLSLSNKYGVFSGELVSFKDLRNEDILYSQEVTLSYSPPVFNCKNPSVLIKGMTYNQYAVKLKNVAVLGISSIIPMSSGKVLYDLPFYDTEGRYLYTDYKIIKLKNRKITYWKGKGQTVDKAISMCGNYSWNFFHFMYEIAIKFHKLSELNLPPDIPVLVDQMCLDIPQYKEILDILNEKRRPLIGVAMDGFFDVNELFYINCPNFIPPNDKNEKDTRSSDVQFDINALKDLRSSLLPHSTRKEFPNRIFISRKNASGRRKYNEDDVIRLFSEFGFATVFPETLSVADQISLFNQAEWIAGGSGAAFTNLLFCNSNCKGMVFLKTHLNTSIFSTIASVANVDLIHITEESANKNISSESIHDDYELDLSYLRELLIKFGL